MEQSSIRVIEIEWRIGAIFGALTVMSVSALTIYRSPKCAMNRSQWAATSRHVGHVGLS